MQCKRCGKMLTNKIIKINGVTLCEDCARVMGIEEPMMGSPFGFLDGDFTNILPSMMSQLQFSPSRTQIKCSKCGTSLRDYETTGLVGCIECYNTFNDSIMRMLMRSQAHTQYAGRMPGVKSDIRKDDLGENLADALSASTDADAEGASGENVNAAGATSADLDRGDKAKNGASAGGKGESNVNDERQKALDEERLSRYENSDLGMLTEEDLREAIKLAVGKEDYLLAARFRDELKGRENT